MMKEKIVKKLRENKAYIRSFYTECAYCGTKDDLSFHHWNPFDKKPIGKMALCSRATIDKELKSGVILCTECHKYLHQITSVRLLIKFKLKLLWNKLKKKVNIFQK